MWPESSRGLLEETGRQETESRQFQSAQSCKRTCCHFLPNGIGTPRVHAVADRQGQTEQLQGVRVLAVQLLSSVPTLNGHLYELHPRLVSVELRRVAGQAAHAPTTQDKIEIVQLPLLQGQQCCHVRMRRGK